jgi:hypothetical protein
MNEELKEKLDTLSVDQLGHYASAARNTTYVLNALGVSLFLVMLTFTNFITIGPGAILVYFISHMAVGLSDTRKYIKERIKSKINS